MKSETETSKPRITRKTIIFPLIGLATFLLYVYLFQVDISTIVETAKRANPIIYGLASALCLIEVFFFAISWRVLARTLLIELSVMKSYLLVWYSIFVDTIIPAESVSGEAVRVYMITREHGKETCGRAVASLVAHRLLGMAMNVIVLIAGMILLFTESQLEPLIFNLISIVAVGITFTLLLIMLLSFKEKWTLKIINGLVRIGKFLSRRKWNKQLTKMKEDAMDIAKSFHSAIKEYRHNPITIITSFSYLAVTWFFSLGIPYLVFVSLDYQVSWSVILITSTVVLAIKSIPLGIPFEVGIPEIAMTTLYTSLGVPPEISATATILIRLITLWLRFFIGFLAQQWLELKPVLTQTNNKLAE